MQSVQLLNNLTTNKSKHTNILLLQQTFTTDCITIK